MPRARSSRAAAMGFLAYGAVSLIAQLVCLQELAIVFAGHELFLGFSLAAWMGWVGLGSWIARRLLATALPLLVASAIPLLLANLLAIRLTKCLFGFGMLIGLLPMLVLTFLLLAPIGLMVGLLFSMGCEWAAGRAGLSLGMAYLWETVGAACGGFLYSWLIIGRLSPAWTLVCLAAPAAWLAATLARLHVARRVATVTFVTAAFFLIAPAALRWSRALQWRGYTLLGERHTRYSHLVLAQTGSLTSLFENGALSAHFPDPAAYEELVHWPLLAHPAARRILIVGNAATGSLSQILQHPVSRIDYVELDPRLLPFLRPALAEPDRAALDDPRVRLIHRDGRRWLRETDARYDVVLLQLPEPRNAQINRLYTLEAFQAIRRHLTPSGLLAFTIPSSENYLSPETLYFNACLFQTLQAVFPNVELVAADPLLLLASPGPLQLDWRQLSERHQVRRLATREVVPSSMPIKLDPRRRAELRAQLESARLPLNRDFVPVCYAYAWRVWLSKFVSPLYFLGTLALGALIAWLLRVLWRWRIRLASTRGPLSVFVLGLAGIVYETVLLLAFQAVNGYVYWQLGFLFAAFMLGLAAGSGLAVRGVRLFSAPQAQRTLHVMIVLTGLEGLGLAWALAHVHHVPDRLPWLALFGPLLWIIALGVGAAFPLAACLERDQPPRRIAGTLYAADLWGASLGCVVTSAVLVPLIGLTTSVALIGASLLVVAVLRVAC